MPSKNDEAPHAIVVSVREHEMPPGLETVASNCAPAGVRTLIESK
jgi:hypothetical protein